MANTEYVFDNNTESAELERLQLIELTHDPVTVNLLNQINIQPGFNCLEIGAGAGSIAYWLADKIGSNGTVTAVDINPRFLSPQAKIKVIKGDLAELELPQNSYDLVHGRFVFLHIPNYWQALLNVVKALKPNGTIILEEPDFSVSRLAAGKEQDVNSVKQVYDAIHQMYRAKNINPFFGLIVPSLFQQAGLEQIKVHTYVPLASGENITKVMQLSVQHLSETLVNTGAATNHDIERFIELSDDPKAWFLHYAHISVIAKKQV